MVHKQSHPDSAHYVCWDTKTTQQCQEWSQQVSLSMMSCLAKGQALAGLTTDLTNVCLGTEVELTAMAAASRRQHTVHFLHIVVWKILGSHWTQSHLVVPSTYQLADCFAGMGAQCRVRVLLVSHQLLHYLPSDQYTISKVNTRYYWNICTIFMSQNDKLLIVNSWQPPSFKLEV